MNELPLWLESKAVWPPNARPKQTGEPVAESTAQKARNKLKERKIRKMRRRL